MLRNGIHVTKYEDTGLCEDVEADVLHIRSIGVKVYVKV